MDTDKGTGAEVWTEQAMLAVMERLREAVAAMFTRDGRLRPVALIFGNYDPDTKEFGKGLFALEGADTEDFGEEAKDRMTHLMKEAMDLSQGSGVVFMSEVWLVETPRAALDMPPSLSPDRQENLMQTFTHRDGRATLWLAPIIRGSGSPTIGPWKKSAGDRVAGRFIDVLPDAN